MKRTCWIWERFAGLLKSCTSQCFFPNFLSNSFPLPLVPLYLSYQHLTSCNNDLLTNSSVSSFFNFKLFIKYFSYSIFLFNPKAIWLCPSPIYKFSMVSNAFVIKSKILEQLKRTHSLGLILQLNCKPLPLTFLNLRTFTHAFI